MGLARREFRNAIVSRADDAGISEFLAWRFPERGRLESCRAEYRYVRLQLAERKRTGSRKALRELTISAAMLTSEIERLEKSFVSHQKARRSLLQAI